MTDAADQARADRQANLNYFRERAAMTDEQLLREFCDGQRRRAKSAVESIEAAISAEGADDANASVAA